LLNGWHDGLMEDGQVLGRENRQLW
jgi:hypothetical protein